MEAKNGHFSVFSSCWKIDLSKKFFLVRPSHQKNFMIFDHNHYENFIKIKEKTFAIIKIFK